MAVKPVVLLAGAVAAYFLSSSKKANASQTDSGTESPKGSGGKDDDLKNLPPPPSPDKDPVELPPLPPINEEDQIPQQEDGNPNFKIAMDKYYSRYLVTNDEQPSEPSEVDLWISKSCNSWGIGKQYPAMLPAKYVYPDSNDLETLIHPVKWWMNIDSDPLSPAPHYFADRPINLPYRSWARNILQLYYPNCSKNIPDRKDFKTYKSYYDALNKYQQTPMGKLYRDLYRLIGNSMINTWEEKYPEKAKLESLRWASLWAVRKFPKLSVTDKTDEAYKEVFKNDKDAPKKLNPKIASHKEYINAWNYMYMEIKSLINKIKNYGDNEDPLA